MQRRTATPSDQGLADPERARSGHFQEFVEGITRRCGFRNSWILERPLPGSGRCCWSWVKGRRFPMDAGPALGSGACAAAAALTSGRGGVVPPHPWGASPIPVSAVIAAFRDRSRASRADPAIQSVPTPLDSRGSWSLDPARVRRRAGRGVGRSRSRWPGRPRVQARTSMIRLTTYAGRGRFSRSSVTPGWRACGCGDAGSAPEPRAARAARSRRCSCSAGCRRRARARASTAEGLGLVSLPRSRRT
jgi:hypothetical protein